MGCCITRHCCLSRCCSQSQCFGTNDFLWYCESGDATKLKEYIDAEKPINIYNDPKSKLWCYDRCKRSGLMVACIFGNPECVSLLVEAGVNINYRDTDQSTALTHAASIWSGCLRQDIDGQYESFKILINAGATIDTLTLQSACFKKGSRFLQLILDRFTLLGTTINSSAADLTICAACENDNVECLKLIINNARGALETAMRMACKHNSIKCITYLIKEKVVFNGNNREARNYYTGVQAVKAEPGKKREAITQYLPEDVHDCILMEYGY